MASAQANGGDEGFAASESAGGMALMAAAAAALAVANSPLAATYFGALKAHLGPLSLSHWINDGLMAVFFLLVGLEIKREFLEGELATWKSRALPGFAAAGGMAAPAAIYLFVTRHDPALAHGWAIPAATDIAFALGVLALLGPRVPASLKVFLTALAILDDLGAVAIIAVFYTDSLNMLWLLAAGGAIVALVGLNRLGVRALWPYLLIGVGLWVATLASGVHATLAGVALALTIPSGEGEAGDEAPLHRLEHALAPWVAFLVVPIFGFANAGVSLAGVGLDALTRPVPLGVAAGLALGKAVGVFGCAALAIGVGLARMPAGANWAQLFGVAVLCGIGFTMSLFIGLLAFGDPALQDQVKIGVLAGSLASGLAGAALLALASRARGADSRAA